MDKVVSLMTGGGIVGAIVVGVASLCLLIWFLLRDQHEDQDPIPNWEFELLEDYPRLEDLLGYLEEYYDREEIGELVEYGDRTVVPPRYPNFTPKQLFLASKWEHLKMPAMFEYTVWSIMTGDPPTMRGIPSN